MPVQLNSFGLLARRFKSINVSNYETGFRGLRAQDRDAGAGAAPGADAEDGPARAELPAFDLPSRKLVGQYPTGGAAPEKVRCYNCGQVGHISFDCQQPQVRKACYTCGNSGHLARDCPQSQRPVICYVCRQPGHMASKCPSNSNSHIRSKASESQE